MKIRNKFNIRLEELHITNFKGFEELSIRLHPQLTVLIGRNGAGKTTVLDGIASLLQYPIDKILRQASSNKSELLSEKDIRNGTREAVNTITVSFLKENGKAKNPENETMLSWYASLSKRGFDVETITEEQAFTEFDTASEAVKIQLRKEEEPTSLPIIAYYPCDNATDSQAITNGETISTEAYNAYDDALSSRSFDMVQFAKWYKWREDLGRDSKNGRDRLKEITEQAVCAILSDEKNQYSDLKTKALTYGIGYELTVLKNKQLLSVNQFSSGEKLLCNLVGSIARRLALANPMVKKPLDGNGIVLIDEIDLHLHPGKQREVLPKLLKIFPNVQFVVTTHSPVVINNLEPETASVLMLDKGAVLPMKHFAGRNIAELMYEYYGIPSRPKDVQKKIDEVFSLIESEQIALAKTKLAYLEGRLGEEDSAVMDAQNSIELLEEIL